MRVVNGKDQRQEALFADAIEPDADEDGPRSVAGPFVSPRSAHLKYVFE